ncbi:RUN and FYVE domain-containing protein 2 [Rhizophlyctis rosea]|nr:RUN and FYVE domain-containing protein 2 [Rhizophlyctis rosea]
MTSTEQYPAERKNLYGRFKAALEKLVDEATASKEVDEENPNLTQLCDEIYNILNHGFAEKRGWYKSKTVWDFCDETLRKSTTKPPGTENLLATVMAMVNPAEAVKRTKVFIKLSLMQQTLGDHIQCLAQDTTWLTQWYSPWALIMQPDDITPIIGMLQGLTQLEFNFYMRGESHQSESTPDGGIAANLISRGDGLIKSSIAATLTTLDNINKSGIASSLQMKMEVVKLEKINQGLQSANNKLGEQLTAAHESIKQLTKSHEELSTNIEHLQKTLEAERRLRLSLEVELMSTNLLREKEVNAVAGKVREVQRENETMKTELARTQQEKLELTAQLDRARLMARVAKAQLDKAQGREGADIGTSTPKPEVPSTS